MTQDVYRIITLDDTTRDERRRLHAHAAGLARHGGLSLTRNDRAELHDMLVAHIEECYRNSRGLSEPQLTATYLLDYVLQHGRCPGDLRFMTRSRQQAAVRARLEWARKHGTISSSLSFVNGREVRCYEPRYGFK